MREQRHDAETEAPMFPEGESASGSGETLPMEPQSYPIEELTAHPRNYRRHPEDQIDHLVRSISEHGFYRPVVVANDSVILAGHGIVNAAKRLGLTHVPAIVLDIPSDNPKALKILTGDNELGRLAEIDDRMLSEILKEIKDVDHLLGTGFDPQMLASLVLVTRPQSEINDINEAADWVGMPDYEAVDAPCKLILSFDNEEDRIHLMQIIDLNLPKNTKKETITAWWPKRDREDPSSLRYEGQRDA